MVKAIMESYLVLMVFLLTLLAINCDSKQRNNSTNVIRNDSTRQSILAAVNEKDSVIACNETDQENDSVLIPTTISLTTEDKKEEVVKDSFVKSDEEFKDKTLKSVHYEDELETNKFKIYIRSKAKKIKKGVKDFSTKLAEFLKFNISSLNVEDRPSLKSYFNLYQRFFKKNYTGNESEERMGIIKRTIKSIQKHNKDRLARYKKGINELSDMKWKEIIKQKLGLIAEKNPKVNVTLSLPLNSTFDKFGNHSSDKDLYEISVSDAMLPSLTSREERKYEVPDSWDWRKYGIVTIPRSQGKCGSCWSFAAATVLESHNMKRHISEGRFDPKKKLTVSEQNLIDCSEEFGTLGCDGGMPQMAFNYVKAKGVVSVEDYPYIGKKGICSYDPNKRVDVIVERGKRLVTGDDEQLVRTLYNYGPVTSAIHVTEDLVAYKNGIFEDENCDPENVNHAVVTVGYTKDYFIVRNSWGPNWGENGYIRISRRMKNICGISQQNYYPVLPNAVQTNDMRHKLVEINE